jgi:hypothetical protein
VAREGRHEREGDTAGEKREPPTGVSDMVLHTHLLVLHGQFYGGASAVSVTTLTPIV